MTDPSTHPVREESRDRVDCTCREASDNRCPVHGDQPFWTPRDGWRAPNFWSAAA